MQSQCEGHLKRKWCGQKERCWKGENGEIEEGKREGKAGRCGEQLRCGAGAVWLLVAVLAVAGFRKGKGKGKGKEKEEEDGGDEGSECISISISSRRVSLEKFECGSWASSGMVVHEDEEGSGSLYFDLPMELIRNSVSLGVGAQPQLQSPVKAAFVFDKNGKTKAKLAVAAAAAASASASALPTPTSSSCAVITPRLRKAREEFNALLEAHTATL